MAAGFTSQASLAISAVLTLIVLYILISGKQWMEHVKIYPKTHICLLHLHVTLLLVISSSSPFGKQKCSCDEMQDRLQDKKLDY